MVPRRVLFLAGRSLSTLPPTGSVPDLVHRLLATPGDNLEIHLHLMEDAVLAARRGSWFEDTLRDFIARGVAITVQVEDVRARGSFPLVDGIGAIDLGGSVDLVFACDAVHGCV